MTFTYVIDSETVETEAPMCTVHQKEGFTLLAFYIASLRFYVFLLVILQ